MEFNFESGTLIANTSQNEACDVLMFVPNKNTDSSQSKWLDVSSVQLRCSNLIDVAPHSRLSSKRCVHMHALTFF